ncbi:uncharacterized protein LOC129908169 isoform X3 [Episyrphus balteatus]|uniref:uncharacterized protein LOC129908169 isoform X3 n=1 Tax=Episyrphus balteatus TaxID=286459 RepID=UPI00248544E7|nr:uncharacterized protein LOC129908169 isoform X3 [Episyrphus balteatus]
MKLSVSAYRAHASAHKKILSNSYHSQHNYGSTSAASTSTPNNFFTMKTSQCDPNRDDSAIEDNVSPTFTVGSPNELNTTESSPHKEDNDSSNTLISSDNKSPCQRKSEEADGNADPDSDWNKSNQRWMKLRTTVQISSAIQKKPPLKREDSFLKRFSTRQIPETQETVEDTGSESASGDINKKAKRRRRYLQKRRSVVNPDENFYFYWLMVLTVSVLYNLWTLIVRQSFPELQQAVPRFWFLCDMLTDVVFILDIVVQLRTGYLEQGLMVYDDKKLACHYMQNRHFYLDLAALIPLDLLQLKFGTHPILRFTRFFKVYRSIKFYYIVESRTVWPNLWRVVNLIHILLILAHWFGCFYYLLSEAEGFQGDWVYPYRPGDYATLTRKYLGSVYWSTLTLTTIGDLPTPETNAEPSDSVDGPRSLPRRGIKSRLLQFGSNFGYLFTITSYLIGVFIFATIVGQVGNVITNRNANRLEFERLLDGAKTYMRHHKVPGGMKRRVLRWYDYSWSRGRIQGGGDINTALGLLPDKLKTELALHVNLSVLKKVTIFQECQPEFLHDLVLKMKAYIFTPGDSICRKGEVAREMFIIADGILEVLSETGKVLTTMKAGDFFGEIGILNLDGLNKRTADVRSVGYSELFSLSREDVLAAMKDYPEAQEILQSLGRKRLMEVRCVNKRHAKAQSDKEAAANLAAQLAADESNPAHHHHHHHPGESGPKSMVDKIRRDVKGFKSVLKKSRALRRSNESLEMQPLHSAPPKNEKSSLKRISRVYSDENDRHEDTPPPLPPEHREKTPSPIGAGLPLLQRLRLLKEKQDREEREVKTTPPQKSPPHSNVTSTLSPQESIQEEPDQEMIETPKILQRLQKLRAKNELMAKEPPITESNVATGTLPLHETTSLGLPSPSLHPTLDISQLSPRSPKPENTITTISSSDRSTVTLTAPNLSTAKPSMKVSFKQRIQQLQSGVTDHSASPMNKTTETPAKPLPPNDSHERNKMSKIIPTISNNITKAASTSLTLCAQKLSKTTAHTSDTSIRPWSKLKFATLMPSNSYTSLSNYGSEQHKLKPHRIKSAESIATVCERPSNSTSLKATATPATALNAKRKNLKSFNLRVKPKFYNSVFDLSPEYSGLPFVKRLKILNERQKLAELETALQTRSFSLDNSKSQPEEPFPESLYRSHSDASAIYSHLMPPANSLLSSSSSLSSKDKLTLCLQDYTQLSPESNETVERRKLKSILKKLSKSSDGSPRLRQDHPRGLLRAPTLEGPPLSANSVVGSYTSADGTAQSERFLFPAVVTASNDACKYKLLTPPDVSQANITSGSREDGGMKDALELPSLIAGKDDPSTMHEFAMSTKQVNNIQGLPDPNEYFSQILSGINNVISSQMREMHLKFESQFLLMQSEVQKRDAIISCLQCKINKMQAHETSGEYADRIANTPSSQCPKEANKSTKESESSGSSGEVLFMRGDSLDTIFTASPPPYCELVPRNSPSSSRQLHVASSVKLNRILHKKSSTRKAAIPNVMVSNLTGNLTPMSNSIILDIGESSSSSSSTSSSRSNLNYDEEENEQPERLVHHNDWEVRMLAAEMDRQEKKRGLSLSDNLTELKHYGRVLPRRRKLSDTETEFSETDVENVQTRPRAGSLDQFNLRYGIGRGIFKAMSIDRGKDKL